jgi:hypothetical protein
MHDNLTSHDSLLVLYSESDSSGGVTGGSLLGIDSLSLNSLSEGTHWVTLQARDQYGNLSDAYDIVFTIDNTPPENPSSAETDCGVSQDSWQNTCTNPTFSWDPADDSDGSGVDGYYYYWGTDPDGTGSVYITENQITENVTESDTYYLRLESKDNLDNLNPAWQTVFVYKYDNEPPFVEYNIDNGSVTTTDTIVRLDINAEDQQSGLDAMRIGLNSQDWTDWMPYQKRQDVLIRKFTDYPQLIKVQLRDNIGNETVPIAEAITLVKEPPYSSSDSYLYKGIFAASELGSDRLQGTISSYDMPADRAFFSAGLVPAPVSEGGYQLQGGSFLPSGGNSRLMFRLDDRELSDELSESYILGSAAFAFPSYAGQSQIESSLLPHAELQSENYSAELRLSPYARSL